MRARQAGFSLLEVLVVCTIFSLFLLVSYGLLSSGIGVWQRTSSSQDVSFQLGKARARLCDDLRPAAFAKVQVGRAPSPAPGQTEGDVLWFLSAIDPSTGAFCRKATDGLPFYQRNVVYYLAAPTDHDALYGVSCASNTDARCPHKFLIRRVFDRPQPTLPTSPPRLEEAIMLPGALGTLLPRPTGFGLRLPNTQAESDELVATGMLSWQVVRGAGVSAVDREIRITMSGFDAMDAGKKVQLGREDLSNSAYTHTIQFSVFPAN